jgi:hypothetical protein
MAARPARTLADPNTPNDPAVEAAFQAVPDTMVAEILDGHLYTTPRPPRRHTNTAAVLGGELYAPFRRGNGGPGGWVILGEPELHLGPKPDKLVPDLAGWRRERMPDALGRKTSLLPVGAAAAGRRKLRARSAKPIVTRPARSGIGDPSRAIAYGTDPSSTPSRSEPSFATAARAAASAAASAAATIPSV